MLWGSIITHWILQIVCEGLLKIPILKTKFKYQKLKRTGKITMCKHASVSANAIHTWGRLALVLQKDFSNLISKFRKQGSCQHQHQFCLKVGDILVLIIHQ
jgi:hypothetical protein